MYNNKRIGYVIVGSFIAAMLIAAMGAIAVLTGRTGPIDEYYVLLDNVADIKFGTQVRFEGYPIGQVERIATTHDGKRLRFRVDLSVAQGWRIPADSQARIGSSSFLAAKTIDIESGESAEAVPPSGRIASTAPVDLFAAIASTAAEFSEVNNTHIKPLLETLNKLAQTVNRDTPRITGEMVTFVEQLNESLVPLRRILSVANADVAQRTIANMEETTGNLAATSRNLSATLDKIDNLVTNLDTLVAANKTGVDQSLKDVRYTLDLISRTIGSVVHNLDGTARNMNEFSRLIRTNPGLLLDASHRAPAAPAEVTERTVER